MTPEEQLEALRIARERGLLSQKQSAAVQELERRRGIGSGGQMNRRMQNEREPWTLGRAFRSANLATMGVPVVNDLAGLLDDSYMYLTEPESRTWGNAAMSAAGALPFIPSAAGIIAGRSAKTLKPETVQLAEKMRDAGASRDEIWRATGEATGQPAFFDERGQLKFEIDDSAYQYTPENLNKEFYESGQTAQVGPASEAMTHSELNKAYPFLRGIETVDYPFRGKSIGNYKPETEIAGRKFPASVTMWDNPLGSKRSTMAHEIQHAIQGQEGFAKGGNENIFKPETRKSWLENPELVQEYEDIKSSSRLQSEIAESNALFDKEYASRLDKLDEMLFSEEISVDEWSRQSDEILNEYKAIQPEKFPLMSRFYKIGEQLGPRELSPNDQYMRLGGEAEARAVQARLDMPLADRINKPFWESYDVPEDEFIYRYE